MTLSYRGLSFTPMRSNLCLRSPAFEGNAYSGGRVVFRVQVLWEVEDEEELFYL